MPGIAGTINVNDVGYGVERSVYLSRKQIFGCGGVVVIKMRDVSKCTVNMSSFGVVVVEVLWGVMEIAGDVGRGMASCAPCRCSFIFS